MSFRKTLILVVAAGAASIGASANADVIASLTYDDLSGSYNSGTQTFTAAAVNNAFLQTSGDTTRLVATQSNATFDPGFVSRSVANFVLNCSVVPTGPFSATGVGAFTATDVDGSTITGTLNGVWGRPAPGFIFFNGTLTNVTMQAADGTFNGEHGSWNTNFPSPAPYEGAIVQLVFGGSTFFTGNFSNRAVGITAQIVPSAGSLALLGLGGMVAGRRRR